MFDSQFKEKVYIVPSYDDGNDLRKQYNQHKLGWCYDDGTNVPALTKDEKKELKLFLEDRLDFKYTILTNKLFLRLKKIRSKNPQRNAIDDLIDLNTIFDQRHETPYEIQEIIFNNVKNFIKGWDEYEVINKEVYKARKKWGGAK